MTLENQFNFNKLENEIYSKWENSSCFKPVKNNQSFCIMMPPPNVTGSLHMGHALTFTIQDILIRYHRMLGKEVLWQAGTDHAGIATQMIVEKQLLEQKIERKKIGRKKFIEKIWDWKKISGNKISNQLKRLGSSADWSRERFTMDKGLSNAVNKAFIDLYNDKVIYKDKRLVNWDPKLLTAISDLEVEQREVTGSIWHIKYPINDHEFIIIATTRPETMLGDAAVVVNPKDQRYKKFIGLECNLPIVDRKINIISDNYADPKKGTGAVKITPAHDFNDFEIGKKHNLKFINIFDKFANLNENVPNRYKGLERYEARKKILDELNSLGLLIKEEKQKMFIPFGDRSGVVIEPLLTDQWFCDAKKLSIDPIKAVKNKQTEFFPIHWEKTFFNWMENIQPWCISRQLWWGHQIPAWYGPDKKIFVANSYDEAKKQALIFYNKDTDLIQDEDVLDTWFSSALWTFSTLDWPEESYELKKFYPGNVLVTGFDIIFFWVARMMMMGSFFMKKTPFEKVYIHPLIRDEKGQKMSKSKGNIIDPLDLIDKYGADTLRFTLTALLNPGRDVKLSESRVQGYKSFTNKIWNAAKFLSINNCKFDNNLDLSSISEPLNQWIINELAIISKKINLNMEKYLFHEIANDLYHFIWHTYCDWYIEFAKNNFQDESKKHTETKKVSIWIFVQILKISHPIIPFITENIWSIMIDDKEFLMNQEFINIEENKKFINSQNDIKNLILIISSIRNLRSELNIPYKQLIEINISNNKNNFISFLRLYSKELKNFLKLKNISFDFDNNKIAGAAYIVVADCTIVIALKGIIDTKVELKKLKIKKDKFIENLNKIEAKLSNSSFISKASNEIKEKFSNDANKIKSSIEKIDQIINTIN